MALKRKEDPSPLTVQWCEVKVGLEWAVRVGKVYSGKRLASKDQGKGDVQQLRTEGALLLMAHELQRAQWES